MNYLQKVEKLPIAVKNFLESNDPRLELEKSCFLYRIDVEEIEKISAEVGLIFVGDINLRDLPNIILEKMKTSSDVSYGIAYEINKRIFNRFSDYFKDSSALLQQWEKIKSAPTASEDEAYKELLKFEPWILEEEKIKAEEARKEAEKRRRQFSALETMPFNDALRKYPEFGEQLITSERIRIQNFPEPVRPSVKNWIADYTSVFGYERNDLMKRDQYLFKSANGQNLTPRDRERLAFVLKAFDENTIVTFNKDIKTLTFREAPSAPAVPPAPVRAVSFPPSEQTKESTPDGELNFSYPQKMPFEKRSVSQSSQPVSSAAPQLNASSNVVKIPPKTISPKNVVNLKEL